MADALVTDEEAPTPHPDQYGAFDPAPDSAARDDFEESDFPIEAEVSDDAPSNGDMDDDIPDDVFDEITGRHSAAAPDGGGLIFECMADVKPQRVEWLWPNRIARGKLTLIAGEPAIGKSQISLDIAARISTGALWPDEGRPPAGSVIILSAEDSPKDTIRPRLEAAGADLRRILNLKAVVNGDGKRRTFSLQADLDELAKKIAELSNVNLVIIDPITSYMGKIDSHMTTDVRAVLEPLEKFAERFDVAVLAITHPPKATQAKALHSVTGSLAFVAAPRLVFIAIEDPETERRLLLAVKNNLGPLADGLGFRLAQRLTTGNIVASHIDWDPVPVDVTANEALAAAANGARPPTPRDEAIEFLRELLRDGSLPVDQIKDAAAGHGHSWRTVERAKAALNVEAFKEGMTGGWQWRLPNPAKGRHP